MRSFYPILLAINHNQVSILFRTPPNLIVSFGMAALISQIMVANKPSATVFAQIVLFAVAFHAVFLYACAAASRTIEWYGYVHTLIIQFFALMPLDFFG